MQDFKANHQIYLKVFFFVTVKIAKNSKLS